MVMSRNNYKIKGCCLVLFYRNTYNKFIFRNYSSALEALLSSAKGCIFQLQSYCSKNIKSSSLDKDSFKNHVVDLSKPGNVYYPSLEQLQDLQNIIYADRDSEISLREHRAIFTRNPKRLTSLKKEIELALSNVFDPSHADKEYSLLAKSLGFSESDLASIIYHLINGKLNKQLLSPHEATDPLVSYTETYTALCENIGNALFDSYLLNLSLLSPLRTKLTNVDDFKLMLLKSFFKKILEGTITKNDFIANGFTLTTKEHFYLLNYKLHKIIIKLSLAENLNFYDVTATLKLNTKAELNFLLQTLTEDNKKYIIRLGALFVNRLLQGGVLVKKIMFKGLKTIGMVQLAEHIDYDSCFPTSYHKPLLHINNKPTDFTAIVGDLSVNLKEDDRIVHNNVNSYGTPKDFLKDATILNSTLTIDSHFYKNIFLPILDHFIDKNFENFSEEAERKNAFRFLQIYNINFENLYLENRTSPKNLKIFTILFNTALNFNIIYSVETKKLFDSNKDYRPFKTYYYKIYSYKFFLWGLFHELEIYSQFKYFIVGKFFSSIGRYFTLSHSLTQQGHNIIRAFVKFLPVKNVADSDFSWFKSCVISVIKDIDVQKALSLIDFASYSEQSKTLAFNSLYKQFTSSTSKEELQKFLENYSSLTPQQQYTYVVDNIKKKDQALYVLGLIQNYMHILDAAQSSYQIGFTDFHGTKESGILCNVLGESNSDLYQFCVDRLLDDINALENSLQTFCKESLNLSLDTLIETPSISIVSRYSTPQFDTFDLSMLIERFVLSDKNSYGYSDYLKKIIELAESSGTTRGISLNFFEYDWILDPQRGLIHFKKLIESNLSPNVRDFLITLYFLRAFIIFKKLLRKYSWLEEKNIIFNRNFFKMIIMPLAYGNTIFGRINALFNHLKKKSIEYGIIIRNKRETRDLRNLCILCEKFFQKFMQTHLKETAKLLSLAKHISENVTKPLTFETLYFKWDFFPYKKRKGKRIVVKNPFGKEVKLSLSKTSNILSKSDVARKLPAYYTHSHDGFQVHAFLYRMRRLKAKLEDRGYVVYFSSNHDGFFVSANFIPFLKYVLVDGYIELYNSEFLREDLKRNSIPLEIIDSFIPTSIDPNRIYKIKFKDINFNNIYQ